MLKPIPVERGVTQSHKITSHNDDDFSEPHSFKQIAFNLLRVFKKGITFTTGQIDELIMGLQRSILHLQKKKHKLLFEQKQKIDELEKGKEVRFKKKRI